MSITDDIVKRQKEIMLRTRSNRDYFHTLKRYCDSMPSILKNAGVPEEKSDDILDAAEVNDIEKCITLLQEAYDERNKARPDSGSVQRLNGLIEEFQIISRFNPDKFTTY